MLTGPLAPPLTDSPPLLKLQYVDKRAFDHFLRYKFIIVFTKTQTRHERERMIFLMDCNMFSNIFRNTEPYI